MSGHGIEACRQCGTVIMQCRCMGPHEVRRTMLCPKCATLGVSVSASPTPATTSEVVNLDDRRPMARWRAACQACGRDWIAVVPADMRAGLLECPECHEMRGIRTAPIDEVVG